MVKQIYSWEIVPGLARNKGIKYNSTLLDVEKKLIEKFQNKIEEYKLESIIPIVSGSYHKSWILLMAAQHYGLPTRLIDFSNNRFAALQFAVADTHFLSKDGALIIYENVNYIQKDVESTELKNSFIHSYNSFFFQAPYFWSEESGNCNLSERRKLIQGSKFLYRDTQNLRTCLTIDENHTHNLIIIHIPAKIKIEIVEYLIKEKQMVYDLYIGRNANDFIAGVLRNEFFKLNDGNLAEFLKY